MIEHILKDFKVDQCCGCTACISSCPTNALYQSKDKYGFIIPEIDESKCIHCGKCVEVCPYKKDVAANSPMETYAAIAKKADVVKNSSSGGIFYELAKAIIKDNGCVCGAIMDDEFTVKHIVVESDEDLRLLQKSKYVQSDINGVFQKIKEYLFDGRRVLFSGTPCQVSGLKNYLGNKEYKNLFLIDIVCHGVPNQDFFNSYLQCLQKRYGKIEKYEFRSKKTDKNGMNWFFSVKPVGKRTKIRNWPEDSYNYMYMKSMIYRDSCYSCKFANTKRFSDITLCDYWGWDSYHINDFPAASTVSGVIINSKKGIELLDVCKEEIQLVKTEYKDLERHNKCLTEPTKINESRERILNLWKNEGYETIDLHFRKTHKKQIIKYKLFRFVPEKILWRIGHLVHKK